MRNNNNQIDFVIPWVDESDIEWQRKRSAFLPIDGEDTRTARYRDWGMLKYLFRSFEQFTPWVNKIFLVTECAPPPWLNLAHPKLRIVNPNTLLPKEYTPTFNVNAIEINLHRIPGLSEHFVYFNDDMLLLKPLKPTDFFVHGLPCDSAALSPVIVTQTHDVGSIAINNMCIINQHFSKNSVVYKHLFKWFQPAYGSQLLRTFCLLPWRHLPGFFNPHLPQPFLRSVFEEIWALEEQRLSEVNSHRFRNYYADVNQWLFRYWQLCSGQYHPVSPNRGTYALVEETEKIRLAIQRKKFRYICINDSDSLSDITSQQRVLNDILSELFPNPSKFESGDVST